MRLFKVLLIAIAAQVILFPSDVSAQRSKVENMPIYDFSKYHFGFILAVNQMHFTIKPVDGYQFVMFDSIQAGEISADSAQIYSIEHQPTVGFTVGIVGDLRLSNYFNLRFIPSLSFGQRYLDYNLWKYRDTTQMMVSIRKDIPSTFVEFPLHIKYKSQRLNNFRAYIYGGLNYRLDLASQAKKREDANIVQVKLKRNDLYYEMAVGFDFYFEWFKLGTEIKMSYGLFDMLKHENNIYTNGIEKLSSKIWQFTFTFE